jgi:hypothetical protein
MSTNRAIEIFLDYLVDPTECIDTLGTAFGEKLKMNRGERPIFRFVGMEYAINSCDRVVSWHPYFQTILRCGDQYESQP